MDELVTYCGQLVSNILPARPGLSRCAADERKNARMTDQDTHEECFDYVANLLEATDYHHNNGLFLCYYAE